LVIESDLLIVFTFYELYSKECCIGRNCSENLNLTIASSQGGVRGGIKTPLTYNCFILIPSEYLETLRGKKCYIPVTFIKIIMA